MQELPLHVTVRINRGKVLPSFCRSKGLETVAILSMANSQAQPETAFRGNRDCPWKFYVGTQGTTIVQPEPWNVA